MLKESHMNCMENHSYSETVDRLPFTALLNLNNDKYCKSGANCNVSSTPPLPPFQFSFGWAAFALQSPSLGFLLVNFAIENFSDSKMHARIFVVVVFRRRNDSQKGKHNDSNEQSKGEKSTIPFVFTKFVNSKTNHDGQDKQWKRQITSELDTVGDFRLFLNKLSDGLSSSSSSSLSTSSALVLPEEIENQCLEIDNEICDNDQKDLAESTKRIDDANEKSMISTKNMNKLDSQSKVMETAIKPHRQKMVSLETASVPLFSEMTSAQSQPNLTPLPPVRSIVMAPSARDDKTSSKTIPSHQTSSNKPHIDQQKSIGTRPKSSIDIASKNHPLEKQSQILEHVEDAVATSPKKRKMMRKGSSPRKLQLLAEKRPKDADKNFPVVLRIKVAEVASAGDEVLSTQDPNSKLPEQSVSLEQTQKEVLQDTDATAESTSEDKVHKQKEKVHSQKVSKGRESTINQSTDNSTEDQVVVLKQPFVIPSQTEPHKDISQASQISLAKIIPTVVNLDHFDKDQEQSKESAAAEGACHLCSKILSSKTNLALHVRRVHDREIGKHECSFCPKKFFDKTKLTIHLRVHTGKNWQ